MDPTATSPPSTAKHAGLPGSAGTLNVILHGLLTIAKASEEITVYVPNMGSDHVYRAGNWLTETTMDQGEFTLTGVTKNKPSEHPFSLEHNLVLQNTHIADANCCNRVYATLHFPYPESTVSLSRLLLPDAGIGGDSKSSIYPNSGRYSARVQILTYAFMSDSELSLGEHPWQPVLDDGFVNLHIFSEPERAPESDHVRHAFQMSIGLFSGVDLSLLKPLGRAEAEGQEIPPGVHELEVQGLLTRQRWFAVLGRAIKEHRDLNGFWQTPVPFNDAGSCSGSGIGDPTN